ncbi:MAG: MarR family transcriptional regulator [Myxococcota bacterium]
MSSSTPPIETNAPNQEIVDIHDSIAYRVHRLARMLRKHFLHLASSHNLELTPEQWFCLNKLRLGGPMSQTDLTEEAFGDRPNITRILTRLEKRGLVHRERDPDDGRRHRVSLTAAGLELHDAFSTIVRDTRDELFQGISTDDMQTAHRVLALLEASLPTP